MPTDTVKGLPEGYKPGLEGVVAGLSDISEVNPDLDALIFRGYAAHELAEKATFSEVAYLLLLGKLPNRSERDAFDAELTNQRAVPENVLSVLQSLPKNTNLMSALRIGVSLLHLYDPDGDSVDFEANLRKAKRLIAQAPTLVAACYRSQRNKPFVAPDPSLSHGANFLYMATGEKPDPLVARAFESTMILYTEHGFNASTFAGLVTASTLSDMHSAVSSAIGALKGPLHGGANEKAIEMLLAIGDESKAEAWLRETLAQKKKVMGFGHRVYKKQDSRAPIMRELARKTAERVGDKTLFPLSIKLEELVKREKKLFPNVDYHGAVFYYLIGLEPMIYTPIFAMSRMVGWTAHVIEQHANNRLIRPKCIYTGAKELRYKPVEERS